MDNKWELSKKIITGFIESYPVAIRTDVSNTINISVCVLVDHSTIEPTQLKQQESALREEGIALMPGTAIINQLHVADIEAACMKIVESLKRHQIAPSREGFA